MDLSHLRAVGLDPPEPATEFRELFSPGTGCGSVGARSSVEPPSQLRVIVSGLMGSGKSTLCRMLAHLLCGVWINQDECGGKFEFLKDIARAASNPAVHVILVDKINTTKQHRRGILDSFRGEVRGKVVLICMRHPLDHPWSFHHGGELCEARIRARGVGHRTLFGDNSELHQILQRTAETVEPLDEREICEMRLVLFVDMTLTPTAAVRRLLLDFAGCGLLPSGALPGHLELNEALRVAAQKESELRLQHEGQTTISRPPRLLFWKVALTSTCTEALRRMWIEHAAGEALQVSNEFHVTLLYTAGKSIKACAWRYAHLTVKSLEALANELSNKEGTSVQFSLDSIVCSDRVATAVVRGLEGLSANVHHHLTLALADGAVPKESNELLACKAAQEDFGNLTPYLGERGLARHSPSVLKWCSSRGISTPEALAAQASLAAASAKTATTHDDREKLETALSDLTRTIKVIVLPHPLALEGSIQKHVAGL